LAKRQAEAAVALLRSGQPTDGQLETQKLGRGYVVIEYVTKAKATVADGCKWLISLMGVTGLEPVTPAV
jgi:hypothetical protein